MAKRSSGFEPRARDFWQTPAAAVRPLLAHLRPRTRFAEPCAGDGALIDTLIAHGHTCAWASDIEPGRGDILRRDAMTLEGPNTAAVIITNPPWTRSVLHPLIIHLSDIAPTWLLFDTDWAHTGQSAPFMARLAKVVSVGRVKWIPDSVSTGKDNVAWHLFDRPEHIPFTQFVGRAA